MMTNTETMQERECSLICIHMPFENIIHNSKLEKKSNQCSNNNNAFLK